MALTKKDTAKLEVLKQTLAMLVGGGLPLEQIETMMAPQISEFQSLSNTKLNIIESDDGMDFDIVDLSKDFLRVREPNEQSKALRAKVQGVAINIATQKDDEYDFSNSDIVKALRDLASELEALPVEINSLVNADVRKDVVIPDVEVPDELEGQLDATSESDEPEGKLEANFEADDMSNDDMSNDPLPESDSIELDSSEELVSE